MIVPLIDFNAEFGSFEKESNFLQLDYCFRHCFDIEDNEKIVIISDKGIPAVNSLRCKKFFWIMEPKVVHEWVYEYIEKNFKEFEIVFCHDKDFCSKIPNSKWYPWGSYFINLNQHQIYPKTKNISIVASSKQFSDSQKLRHQIINKYSQFLDGVKQGGFFEPKILWHKDYRFSIAVENCFVPGYFTEKIIDCFRTGTIPIYAGDPDINNYGFNKDGIITFSSLEELADILSNLNEEFYMSRIEAVKFNFEKAFEYLFPWKFIYENYLKDAVL